MKSVILVVLSLLATSAMAHSHHSAQPVVVDTDMGLDDLVAISAALQNPKLQIVAVVATEGVAAAKTSVVLLERLLHRFNRGDIAIYQGITVTAKRPNPPSFRQRAVRAVSAALPGTAPKKRLTFAPEAYRHRDGRTVVLALGPLTNLAAALKARPKLKGEVARVVYEGRPDPQRSWNTRFDQRAFAVVKASGVPLELLLKGPGGRKPKSWRKAPLFPAPRTAIGAQVVERLLSAGVREHYATGLPLLTDELGVLYLVAPKLFQRRRTAAHVEVRPRDARRTAKRLLDLLGVGRLRQRSVALRPRLPDDALAEDVLARRARIVARGGPVEWRAMLVMNELHQHLGAYSIIGVKMGLWAAELLNAPDHGIKIVSKTSPRPPISCLNDGVIVATGATPGRGLFSRKPGKVGSTDVTFEYNGRRITLRLKKRYHRQLAAELRALRKKHGLSKRYWNAVRRRGIEIWERWHRAALFDRL